MLSAAFAGSFGSWELTVLSAFIDAMVPMAVCSRLGLMVMQKMGKPLPTYIESKK